MSPPANLEALPAWLGFQMATLTDTLSEQPELDFGVATVTGTLQVTTRLTIVEFCLVSLKGVPVAGACFPKASPVVSPTTDVVLNVYKSDFTLSATPIDVTWLAGRR